MTARTVVIGTVAILSPKLPWLAGVLGVRGSEAKPGADADHFDWAPSGGAPGGSARDGGGSR